MALERAQCTTIVCPLCQFQVRVVMRAAHRWEVLAEMAAAVRREAKVVLEAKVVRMEIYFPHCQGSMAAMTGMEGQDLDSAFRLEMGPLQVLVALLVSIDVAAAALLVFAIHILYRCAPLLLMRSLPAPISDRPKE